ncbi:MAG: TetR/AcrR family transcriptional regulator [Proteobacteria bacterium]|nr:TetR/AcrR family transcriptional regulator [Pseudomonadota bacterium]
MARPRTIDIDIATPERILAAAELAFAEQGFAGARLADIARSAGLRRPSLLYHFKSKDVLYAAVVGRSFSRLAEALVTAQATEGGFEHKLRALAECFDHFLEEQSHVAQIVVRELLDSDGPGGQLLLSQAGPLLDQTDAWLRAAGKGQLRPGLDVRVVLTHVASDALLRHASGSLRRPLWGPPLADRSWQMAQTLLLTKEH